MSIDSPPTIISVPVLQGSILREDVEIPSEIQILEQDETVPEFHHCFSIIDPAKGDERLTWDNRCLQQIAAAKKTFVALIQKNLRPFKVGINGLATSDVMTVFDPLAEEVIFLPMAPVKGG